MVFFALTNLLVASGWTLALDPVMERRIRQAEFRPLRTPSD
jgi:hypothetical protein